MIQYSTTDMIFAILLSLAALFALWPVYSRDIMMLQQNSYRNERYSRWFSQSGESTNLNRIFGCVALFFLLITRIPFVITASVAIVVSVCIAWSLLKKKYKKPLVWTPRARRIIGVMWGLTAIITALCWIFLGLRAAGTAIVALAVVSPLVLLVANDLLKPVEKSINRKYYNEAAGILASMPDLKIIGITGSYGKTSTKHYLNRILEEHFSTAMTPGSFNTTLGVIRTVREHLKPYNEVFIVEMGAKQPGDIKEICDLVHPSMGIITAVGEQHMESFKTIDNVQRTKFELADSLPSDGLIVVNNDFPSAADREVVNTGCVHYGVSNKNNADYTATGIQYSPDGTTFTITGADLKEPLVLRTKLVGECNVSNLLAAVVVALRLGVPVDKIRYAVGCIEQVEHRLNMKRTPGGITIIDDAFNSNPQGSRMALEVLSMMRQGKRIVITPGMIELGDLQQTANEELGRNISRCADVAIIVGRYNRDAIMAGIAGGPMHQGNVHVADSFGDAQKILASLATSGDTVLYENDLPDTFK